MRLLLLATGIVVGVGIGAWGISRLLPEAAPQWLGVTLCIVWLFLLIFAVTMISSNRRRAIEDQRRLLTYGLLAAVLVGAFLVPLFAYKVNVPKWAAELVVAAIVGAVFLLSKHIKRRKLQRTAR